MEKLLYSQYIQADNRKRALLHRAGKRLAQQHCADCGLLSSKA